MIFLRDGEANDLRRWVMKKVSDKYGKCPYILKWLYMRNLLRKSYSRSIIKIQDKFREGSR